MPASLQMRRSFWITTLPETCFSMQTSMFISSIWTPWPAFNSPQTRETQDDWFDVMEDKAASRGYEIEIWKGRNPFPDKALQPFELLGRQQFAPPCSASHRSFEWQRGKGGCICFEYQCGAIRLLQEVRDDGIKLNLQAFLGDAPECQEMCCMT